MWSDCRPPDDRHAENAMGRSRQSIVTAIWVHKSLGLEGGACAKLWRVFLGWERRTGRSLPRDIRAAFINR